MTDEASKKAILKRRARFVAAALASAGIGAAVSCGGETSTSSPQPCLKAAVDAGGDGEPQVFDAGPDADSGPQPCLEPPMDAAPDAASDGSPQPCLTPK